MRWRFVRKGFAHKGTLSALLDSGSAAGILNESSFAGACPMACF
jgi:hypothetical protein